MTLDLKALRQANHGIRNTKNGKTIGALIDALEEARREIAEHEASDKEWGKESDAHYTSAYKRGAETARALAFEEAARYWGLHKIADSTEQQFADDLRRLSPLPPGLLCVERLDLVAVAGLLRRLRVYVPHQLGGNSVWPDPHHREIDAALALLEKVK